MYSLSIFVRKVILLGVIVSFPIHVKIRNLVGGVEFKLTATNRWKRHHWFHRLVVKSERSCFSIRRNEKYLKKKKQQKKTKKNERLQHSNETQDALENIDINLIWNMSIRIHAAKYNSNLWWLNFYHLITICHELVIILEIVFIFVW